MIKFWESGNVLSIDGALKNFGIVVIGAHTGSILHVETIKHDITGKDKSLARGRAIHAIVTRVLKLHAKYHFVGMTAEKPIFASQAASSTSALSCAGTIIFSVQAMLQIDCLMVTAQRIKKQITGDNNGHKQKIIEWCCRLYKWEIGNRVVRRKTGTLNVPVYHVRGKKMGTSEFEHIADAIGAFYTCKYTDRKEVYAINREAGRQAV